MPRARTFPGHMHPEGPWVPRAHPCRGPTPTLSPFIQRAHVGPPMPRAYPCPGPIRPKRPSAPIHADGSSLPGATLPSSQEALPCPEPMDSEGPSLQGPYLLRAYPCRGPMETYPYPEHIHTEGPSQPSTHQSRGTMVAHPFGGPIPAQGYPSRRPIGSYPCSGPIRSQRSPIPRAM